MSEIWQSDNRKISAELYVGTSGSISFGSGNLNTLANFTLERSLVSGNNLTFGNVCSSTLTVTLKNVTSANLAQIYNNQYVALLLTCEDLDTQQSVGEYYTGYFIDEITKTPLKSRNTQLTDVTIVCHDFISRLDVEYTPTIDISAGQTVSNIAYDCIANAGHPQSVFFTLRGFSNQLTVNTLPENVSRREELGYLAGYQGVNIIARPTGDIDQVVVHAISFRNNFNIRISKSMQYMDEMSIEGDTVFVSRVESGTENDIVVYPTDGSLVNSVSYPCPYITNKANGQQRVREIQESIIAFAKSITPSATSLQFEPMSVRWRGDMDVDVGDYIRVEDQQGFYSRCLVMSNTISFDGGLSQTLKCYGEAQKTVAFNTNTTMRAFERQITHLETEISDATAAITDLSIINGEFSFIKSPTDNHNIGWKIISLADGHFIECNKNGIGFSSNAGQTFDTAIYIDENGDGHINGTYITGLVVTTSMLDFTPVTTANVDSYVQADINSWYNGLVIQGSKISSISSIPGYSTLNGRINSKVSATQAENIASEQVAAFASSGKFTYIGDDGIYTGSITAKQVRIGYGGTNYAFEGTASIGSKLGWGKLADGTIGLVTMEQITNNQNATAISQPFYIAEGATIQISCNSVIPPSATGHFVVQIFRTDVPDLNSARTYVETMIVYPNPSASVNTPYETKIVASKAAYYWLRIFPDGDSGWFLPSSCGLHNIVFMQTMSGEAIVHGVIRSADGKTYFDLDSSTIVTTVADNVTSWKTQFSGGGLNFTIGEQEFSSILAGYAYNNGTITERHLVFTLNSAGTSFLFKNGTTTLTIIGKTRFDISTDLYVKGIKINTNSTEAAKKQISEYTGDALGLINNSKIYKFLYKEEEDTDPYRYGVIIERECPKEIVEKTNDAISVYSMASLSWKAIQELSKRIDNLEEKL